MSKNKEIPNWLIELVKEQPNNMQLGEMVRAKVNKTNQWLIDQYNRNRSSENHIDDIADISNKDFNPEGKPSEDGDYWFTKSWFSKDDRKQRG